MTTIKKIGLDDLQDLAKYFANLKVVDLKMNTIVEKIPSISRSFSYQEPSRESVGSHNTNMRELQPDFQTGRNHTLREHDQVKTKFPASNTLWKYCFRTHTSLWNYD